MPLIILHALPFVGIKVPMIASAALRIVIPAKKDRGAFMAVEDFVHQAAGVAGLIVFQSADGMINRFAILGGVVVCMMLITKFIVFRIHIIAKRKIENPKSNKS